MTSRPSPRRDVLKSLAAIGTTTVLVAVTGTAYADKNAALRTALKYQDMPKDGHDCAACVQFVPGKTPKDKGGCKAIPNDNEISPTGWCAAFVAKK